MKQRRWRSSSADNRDISNQKHLYSQGQLRKLAKDALEQHMLSTAIAVAEEISLLIENDLSDQLFYASCLYNHGEYRRCLNFLESKSLLSAELLSLLGDLTTPQTDEPAQLRQATERAAAVPASERILSLSAVLLAAQSLCALEQYEDCLLLLEGLVATDEGPLQTVAVTLCCQLYTRDSTAPRSSSSVNVMAGVYCAAAVCYEHLENQDASRRSYAAAVLIDPQCLQALDALLAGRMLALPQRTALYARIDFTHCAWLRRLYKARLLTEAGLLTDTGDAGNSGGSGDSLADLSPLAGQGLTRLPKREMGLTALVLCAEHLLEHTQSLPSAYRLARQAYFQDPFCRRAVAVYVNCLTELSLTAELFYIGHELTAQQPRDAMSWFAVGCYYWCCHKLELAQKHLQKCTKMDKRFAAGYLMLARVLAAQEERELAVSALRTVCRLLPGDYRPLVLLAKELVRLNCLSQALHLLLGAQEIAPLDPVLLNELGVTYLLLDREADALICLEQSVNNLHLQQQRMLDLVPAESQASVNRDVRSGKETESSLWRLHREVKMGVRHMSGAEIYSNYATVLRRAGCCEEATEWYRRSLAEDPQNSNTLTALAFTLHLQRRFDEAVTGYHRALALDSTSAFCGDMLTVALDDLCNYPDASGHDGEGAEPEHDESDGMLEREHIVSEDLQDMECEDIEQS